MFGIVCGDQSSEKVWKCLKTKVTLKYPQWFERFWWWNLGCITFNPFHPIPTMELLVALFILGVLNIGRIMVIGHFWYFLGPIISLIHVCSQDPTQLPHVTIPLDTRGSRMVCLGLQKIKVWNGTFSRMRSKGFPFIVWGSGGWTLVRLQLLVASLPRRRGVVVGPSSGRRRVVNSVSCLWGKLQNLSFLKVSKSVVMSFCVAGVALCDIPTCVITCQKCQNWRKPRTKCSFCCAHVSRLESLLFLWPRRVFGGSCKTIAKPCLVSSLCFSSGVAVSMGEAAKPRSFCCAHVAVSMGKAAKPHKVALGIILCASFVVQSSTGTYCVQAL